MKPLIPLTVVNAMKRYSYCFWNSQQIAEWTPAFWLSNRKEEKSCEFRRKRIKFTQKNTSNFLPFQHDTDFYSEFSFTQNDIRVSFQSKVGISLDKNSSIFFTYKLDDNKLDQRKMWLHHRQKLKVFNDLWPFYTIVQIIND